MSITQQLEELDIITLNTIIGTVLYWGLLGVALVALIYGLFGRSIAKLLFDRRQAESERSRFKSLLIGTSRVIAVVLGVASALAYVGAIHTMQFVGVDAVAVAKDGALEQGAYIIFRWNPEPRFVIERSGQFTREVSGQIDPATNARVDLTLNWEYRVRDAGSASALYPILRTHGSIEAYTDWELAAIVKNPNSLEGLQQAIAKVCSELATCGVEVRALGPERHTFFRQYDASGVRLLNAEQVEDGSTEVK